MADSLFVVACALWFVWGVQQGIAALDVAEDAGGGGKKRARNLYDAVTGHVGLADELKGLSRSLAMALSVVTLFTNMEFLYYSAYVVFTILGNAQHHFFFAFHLLDVVLRYEEVCVYHWVCHCVRVNVCHHHCHLFVFPFARHS